MKIVVGNRLLNLETTANATLQTTFKMALKKSIHFNIADNYKSEVNRTAEDCSKKNVWLLKDPRLISCRLKLQYKDIFSNARRLRANITDNDKCTVCGLTETTEHMLLHCPNASRLWCIYQGVFNCNLENIYSLVCCHESLQMEILKTLIFKALLKIDRSQFVSTEIFIKKSVENVRILTGKTRAGDLNLLIEKFKKFAIHDV